MARQLISLLMRNHSLKKRKRQKTDLE